MSRLRALAAGFASALALQGCAPEPKCGPPALAVAVPAVAPAGAPTAEAMTKATLVLDRFHAAAASADEEAYFAFFGEGGVFLGTDGKERWTVPQFRAYAHPRFATGKAWSFRAIHRDLSVRGEIAWFDEDLDTPNLGRARGSGVLARDPHGEWKIVQYNLSVPIPNERFADVKKLIDGEPAARPAASPPRPNAPAKPAPHVIPDVTY